MIRPCLSALALARLAQTVLYSDPSAYGPSPAPVAVTSGGFLFCVTSGLRIFATYASHW
jgi:hypothetical protein